MNKYKYSKLYYMLGIIGFIFSISSFLISSFEYSKDNHIYDTFPETDSLYVSLLPSALLYVLTILIIITVLSIVKKRFYKAEIITFSFIFVSLILLILPLFIY